MQWRVTSGEWLEKIPRPAKASGTRPGSEAVRENHSDKKLRLDFWSALIFEWFTGNSNSEPPRLDSGCWKLEARCWTSTAEVVRQNGRRGSPRRATPSGTRTVRLPPGAVASDPPGSTDLPSSTCRRLGSPVFRRHWEALFM